MSKKKLTPLGLGLKVLRIVLPVALFWWLLATGRLDLSRLAEVRPGGWLGAVIVAHLVMFLLAQWRWALLARAQELRITAGGVLKMGTLGYCANLVIPGGLGYDGVRTAYLVSLNRDRVAAAATTPFVDRILGMMVLFVLGPLNSLLLLAFGSGEETGKLRTLTALCLVALAATMAGSWLVCSERGSALLGPLARIEKLQKLLTVMRSLRSHKRIFARMIVISFAMQLVNCLGFYAAFRALNFDSDLLWVLAVRPLLIVVASLPIAPMGGLGVADSLANELFVNLAGMPGGAEVTLFWRIIMMTMSLLFAAAVQLFGISAPPVAPPDLKPDLNPDLK